MHAGAESDHPGGAKTDPSPFALLQIGVCRLSSESKRPDLEN